MSVSPFDHPLLSGLVGDDEIAPQFTPAAEIEEFNYFEAALAQAEAAEGVIPDAAAAAIAAAAIGFAPDFGQLRAATGRDGVVVPDYVRQLRAAVGTPHGGHLHFGATSQDLVDTGLIRRLAPVLTLFAERLAAIVDRLAALEARFGATPLMGRTRMQAALPITVADRLAAWQAPLPRHLERLDQLRQRLLLLQFGGAVGTLDKLGDKGPAVARRLGEALDLAVPPRSWHAARDNLAELAGWLALVSGSLGKLGEDVALMAQAGEIALAGGGSSSAMPHKSNPVTAEVLVALGRYNGSLVGSMMATEIHEQERSGSAWTLEWLALPQMVMATGAGLRVATALLDQVTRLGEAG